MSFTEGTPSPCPIVKAEVNMSTNNGIKDQGMDIDVQEKVSNNKENHSISINRDIQITSRDLLSKVHKS